MVVLTVTGLFKERHSNSSLEFARTFQKTMIIVPNNGGFCIKNEMLHINNASPAQSRNAFKPPVNASSLQTSMQASGMSTPMQAAMLTPMQGAMTSSMVPSVMPTTSAPQQLQTGGPNDVTKMQMIQAMSLQSNMNVEWSRKCLEETNWDFTRAGFVFSELFKQSKIPPEAFVK